MAGSVEHKIFQESPTAPTPHELREGICLLLDTFGHPEYHYAVDPQNREPFTFNQLSGRVNLPDGNSERATFKSSIGHDGPGCVGVHFEGVNYSYDSEIHEDPQTHELVAVLNPPSNETSDLRSMLPAERKALGGLVLASWLKLQDQHK